MVPLVGAIVSRLAFVLAMLVSAAAYAAMVDPTEESPNDYSFLPLDGGFCTSYVQDMRQSLFNIDPSAETDLTLIAACDAFDQGDPRAMSMLVGLPASVSIGSDTYGAQVVRVTAKTIRALVNIGSGQYMEFRYSTKHDYWAHKTHHILHVGRFEHKMDPSF